ncbi:MAG: winged helix-turn-helix domain-containing protein [Candidatus Bathyarchaeia archaeon]
MLKEPYHPKAYLTEVKNIKRGLLARTKILNVLDKGSADAKTLAEQTGMRYSVVVHHLRLLETEGIVERKRSKPNIWALTGLGQKRLI